jgi:nitrogen fixation NifU-like protein
MSRFSEILMDHFSYPRNQGRMDSPDCVGTAGTPGNGPFIALYLKLEGDRIAESKYQCNGCGVTIAAGSMLTEMIAGRTIEECLAITPEQLAEALDGVPPDKAHAPVLAVAALREALKC